MKRLLAAAGFIVFGGSLAVVFSDVLFPLSPSSPVPRAITSAGLDTCLKVLPGRDIGRG